MKPSQMDADALLALATGAIALASDNAIQANTSPNGHDSSPERMVLLLTALRGWCQHQGFDWNQALVRAEELFAQTHPKTQSEQGSTKAPPTIDDLRCPKCGHTGTFIIEIRDRVFMCAEGEVGGRKEWGYFAYCECASCEYAAMVLQFLTTPR